MAISKKSKKKVSFSPDQLKELRDIWEFANDRYTMLKTSSEESKSHSLKLALALSANCVIDIMDELALLINSSIGD